MNNVCPRSVRGHEFGQKRDYATWEECLRKEERFVFPEANSERNAAGRILAALEEAYGDVFAELAEGLDRPGAQFLPAIGEGLKRVDFHYQHEMPHLNTIRVLSNTLALRISAAAEGGDVRVKEGIFLSFDLIHLNDELHTQIAEMIKDYWAEIGVEANLVPLDAQAMLTEYLEPREYDVALQFPFSDGRFNHRTLGPFANNQQPQPRTGSPRCLDRAHGRQMIF